MYVSPCLFYFSPFATESAMSIRGLEIFFFNSQAFYASDSSNAVAPDCSAHIRIMPLAMRAYPHKPNPGL